MPDTLWMPFYEQTDVTAIGDEWPVYSVSRWERNEIGETRFTGESRTYRPIDALTAAAKLVDAGWMATDEGENVRLRYASDLPARLLTLRKVLDGTYEEPSDPEADAEAEFLKSIKAGS